MLATYYVSISVLLISLAHVMHFRNQHVPMQACMHHYKSMYTTAVMNIDCNNFLLMV